MKYRPAAALIALAASFLACGSAPDFTAGLARVSQTEGDVTVEKLDSHEIDIIVADWPIRAGDRLMTEPASRAELSIGPAAVSLDEETDVIVSSLEPDVAQLLLQFGSIDVTVGELRNHETLAVKMPGCMVQLRSAGDYRLTVLEDRRATVLVRSGEARVEAGLASFQQLSGERARIGSDGSVDIERAQRDDRQVVSFSDADLRL